MFVTAFRQDTPFLTFQYGGGRGFSLDAHLQNLEENKAKHKQEKKVVAPSPWSVIDSLCSLQFTVITCIKQAVLL